MAKVKKFFQQFSMAQKSDHGQSSTTNSISLAPEASSLLLHHRRTPNGTPAIKSSTVPGTPIVNGFTSPVRIEVHPLTEYPTSAWADIGEGQEIQQLDEQKLTTKAWKPSRKRLRVVCISDTHSLWDLAPHITIPDGDILLHAGDLTMSGKYDELYNFNLFMGRLPHKYKIVIAGNHDVRLDEDFFVYDEPKSASEHLQKIYGVKDVRDLLTNCTYIQDQMVTVEGISIYGSPWKPDNAGDAFYQDRGEDMLEKWNQIPDQVDILMTHGPPAGIGDMLPSGHHVGCVELLNTVQKCVKPKYHVFGHIHEGYGAYTDGTTTYINGSFCTRGYEPKNPPIVFDIDIPNAGADDKVVKRKKTETGASREAQKKPEHL